MRTNAGTNWQALIMGDSGAAGAGTGASRPADFIALSEDGTAPAATDTTLTGELTDSGLARAQAAYAHTVDATNYTLTKTFTSGGGNPTRTIRKMAVFNAGAAGTMAFESLVPNPPVLIAADQVTITETVNLV